LFTHQIILHISSFLNREDHMSLRATCTRLDAVTLNSFTSDYFFEVQVNCTVADFCMLVEMAQSRIRGCIKRVTVGICALPKDDSPEERARIAQILALEEEGGKRAPFIRMPIREVCTELLYDALSRLDVDVITMTFGFPTPWKKTKPLRKSQGGRTMFTPLLHGADITKMSFEPRGAIMIVFAAMSKLNWETSSNNGTTNTSTRRKLCRLGMNLGCVNMDTLSSIPQSLVSSALAEITSLYLDMNGTCRCHNRVHLGWAASLHQAQLVNQWPAGADVYHLHWFLARIPKLLVLVLSYQCVPRNFYASLLGPPPLRRADGTYHMIPTPGCPDQPSLPVLVGQLTYLHIHSAYVDPNDLLHLIGRLSSTLESLTLAGVRFGWHGMPVSLMEANYVSFVKALALKLKPRDDGAVVMSEESSGRGDGSGGAGGGNYKLREIGFRRSPFIVRAREESAEVSFPRFFYKGSTVPEALMLFLELLKDNVYVYKYQLENINLFELGIEGVIKLGYDFYGGPSAHDITLRGRGLSI
jgi:hypothetical protein